MSAAPAAGAGTTSSSTASTASAASLVVLAMVNDPRRSDLGFPACLRAPARLATPPKRDQTSGLRAPPGSVNATVPGGFAHQMSSLTPIVTRLERAAANRAGLRLV